MRLANGVGRHACVAASPRGTQPWAAPQLIARPRNPAGTPLQQQPPRAGSGEGDRRQQDILRRAEELAAQQRALAEELESMELSDAQRREVLSLLGLGEEGPPGASTDQPPPSGGARPAASTFTAGGTGQSAAQELGQGLGDMPAQVASFLAAAGVLGTELPPEMAEQMRREHGWREGEEGDGEGEERQVGEGVEDLARVIEAGGQLPPYTPEGIHRDPEPAEDFEARIRASIANWEGGGRGRKHRAPGDPPPAPLPEPDWDHPFDNVPIVPQDILGMVPAPDLPPHIDQQTQRVERIAYVLRRAHMEQGAPGAALAALAAGGLVAGEELCFEDDWLALEGLEDAREYMGRLEAAGARFELSKIFAGCPTYEPLPEWEVVADVWIHLPLPPWYLQYLAFHAPPPPAATGESPPEVPLSEHQQPPGEQYPRVEGTPTAGEVDGTAHLRWLRPWPGAAPAPLYARNPFSPAGEREGQEGQEGLVAELAPGGLLRLRWGAAPSRPRLPDRGAAGRRQGRLPDYSPLRSSLDDILEAEWGLGPAAEGGSGGGEGEGEEAEPEPYGPDFGPDGEPRTLDDLTQQQAGRLLRRLLGSQYDALMQQLPRKGRARGREQKEKEVEPGAAWRAGGIFTVAATFCYSIDPEAGLVSAVTCAWGGVAGGVAAPSDAYDIYLRETGVLTWKEQEGWS